MVIGESYNGTLVKPNKNIFSLKKIDEKLFYTIN